MPSGDFTQKAYQQLRDAYADSLSTQDEQELAGKEILGQQMSLETLPVNSPWRSQIKDWQYPNGKSEYLDGKQSPEEILELMRDSVRNKVEADEAEEGMSDEELEAILAQLLDEEKRLQRMSMIMTMTTTKRMRKTTMKRVRPMSRPSLMKSKTKRKMISTMI